MASSFRFSGDWQDLLEDIATSRPHDRAFGFLERGVLREQCTYLELLILADALAAWFQQHFAPGERVVLLFSPGLAFVEAFWGCTRAGLIPVPLSPSLGRHKYAPLQPILISSGAVAVLGPRTLWQRQKDLVDESRTVPQTGWLDWGRVKTESQGLAYFRKPCSQGGIAFLQYTSGSIGHPKGVIVDHSSLLHNLKEGLRSCALSEDDTFLGWIPHFHDMGLIGVILNAIYHARPALLMAPAEFARQPHSWLEAISVYRATITFAPSSALAHCQRLVGPDCLARLDLSSMRTLVCGSEPIHGSTLKQFLARFASTGLPANSIYCAYGLAEATLTVCGCYYNEDGSVGQLMAPSSCGPSIAGQIIKIVDPVTFKELPDDQEGLILVKGPSVNQGYWNEPEATEETFNISISGEPGYMNTGDLGRLCHGELIVAGRFKDLIIVSGRNIYPQDVEWAALEMCPHLRLLRCLAFESVDPLLGSQLVLLAELERGNIPTEAKVALRSLGGEISRVFGVTVAEVLLLPLNALPRTTSGKLRRQEAKRLHQLGEFEPIACWSRANPVNEQVLDDRSCSILMMVKRRLSLLTGLDPLGLEADHRLNDLALGSLQLAELKVGLDQDLDVDFPIEPFVADITLRQLADQLSEFVANAKSPEGMEQALEHAIVDDSASLRQLMLSGLPDHLRQLQRQHGDFVTLRWGRQLIHLLSDPQEVENLMQRPVDEFIRGKVSEGIRMVTDGRNLFTTEGQAWRQERHRAQPLFKRQAVEAMAAEFAPIARACLKQRLDGRLSADIDLAELSRAITLECTLHQLFGAIPEPLCERLAAALQEATDWQLPLHYLAGADLIQASSPGTSASVDTLLPILDELIFAAIDDQMTGSLRHNTMLGAYLSDADVQVMEAGVRRSYLRSVMLSLLLAGLETTGSGLYFSLDLIARHPEVQKRVSAEVSSAFVQGEIGPEELSCQLSYTLATVQEALRLYPPVWFLGREAVAATEVMGHPISQGDIVLTSPYVIHRHPEHWQDPDGFRPERFFQKPVAGPGSHLYFPFGVGPRTCVGRWLALYEITLAMAALVQRYQLSSDGEERLALSSYFTLKTLNPITLRVEARC